MIALYHYEHCPYGLRVRMALGYLHIPYESVVLAYDDEDTPLKMTGKKMLPIIKWEDGSYENESLILISKFDKDNRLRNNLLANADFELEIDTLLSTLGTPIHNLCMPYWIYTKEFNEQSRSYFQKKKEIKRGPFEKLVSKNTQYLEELAPILEKVEKELTPYYKDKQLSLIDLMLASHLWGLYIFPEFQFSPRLHQYLQDIKKKTKFDYHQDFWK